MARLKTEELDAFFQDIQAVPDAPLGFAALTDTLPAVPPPALLRDRILDDARPGDRLARFVMPIASLLDIEPAAARTLLARIDDPSAWFELLPGISVLLADGGPNVRGALRAFVKVRAGTEFPLHEHFGEESVMIMQGYYADSASGDVFGPGDTPIQPRGSQHSFRVLADGPDLLGLVVAQGGLRMQGREFLPF